MSQDRDPLLEALATAARDERAREPDDPRLDALVAGELAEAERDALAAQAADDAALAAAVEALTPFDRPTRGRFAAAALAAFDGDQAQAEPEPPAATPPTGARVIPFRRSMLGKAAAVVTPLALAAGLALVLLRPGGPAVDPLPGFSAEVTGGEQATRADAPPAAGPRTLGPGSQLSVLLVPDQAVQGAVAVRAWLVQGEAVRPWPVSPERGPTGAQRVAGTFEALGLAEVPAGRWTAVFVVGRPQALPAQPPAEAPGDDAGWQRLTVDLRLRR